MALPVIERIDLPDASKVPEDRFGVRLAMIRAEMGWNIKQAASACGVNEVSWKRWERGGSPHNYEAVCRQISDAAGYDLQWLKAGGELARSRCTSMGDLRIIRGGKLSPVRSGQMIPMPLPLFTQSADN